MAREDVHLEMKLEIVSGWSVYINGLQVPYEEFAEEVRQVVEHVKAAA